MENKELETWLKETKAKNLSKEDLKYCTISLDSVFYNKLRKELKVVGTLYEHLFNQWQKESEFSPKRGDRVLVWNDNDDPIERIFLAKIKGLHDPIIFVAGGYEDLFKNNELFDNAQFQHMKPLPTEQTTETEFSPKIIGYKAPFDLFRGTIKKGSIFPPSEHNTSVYNKYGVPIEVVETWEAVYEAPTEQPTETDFKSKVIELIEGKINATTTALETIISIQKDLLEQVKNLC